MPKRPPKVITPPAPTAPKPMAHADSPKLIADSGEYRAETPEIAKSHTLAEATEHGHTLTETQHAALKKNWRCPHDGQLNNGSKCTTCGTERK